MAKTTKAAARPKKTKAEIEEEFSEIRDEVEEAREGARPKVEEQLKLREAEVRQAVDGLSVESVVSRMSGLGLEVSKGAGPTFRPTRAGSEPAGGRSRGGGARTEGNRKGA